VSDHRGTRRRAERDHADLCNELDEAKHALRQQGTAIGRVHTQAMEYVDERDRALRTFISSQLESGVGRTLAGVAFSPWA
jgi:hypothetical protein